MADVKGLKRRLRRAQDELEDERDPGERRALRRRIARLEDDLEDAENDERESSRGEVREVSEEEWGEFESWRKAKGEGGSKGGEEGEEEPEGDEAPRTGPKYFRDR